VLIPESFAPLAKVEQFFREVVLYSLLHHHLSPLGEGGGGWSRPGEQPSSPVLIVLTVPPLDPSPAYPGPVWARSPKLRKKSLTHFYPVLPRPQ
jgi:hypothetical protein